MPSPSEPLPLLASNPPFECTKIVFVKPKEACDAGGNGLVLVDLGCIEGARSRIYFKPSEPRFA